MSFCARARILTYFFKSRCLSHTGPNCRQCEASNTLACKFLKKEVFTTLFKNALLRQIASSGTLLSGSTVSSKGVEIWQKVENNHHNHKSFSVKKKFKIFHFIFRRASGRPLPLPNLLFLLHEKKVALSKGTLVQGFFVRWIITPLSKQTRVKHCNAL